MLVLGCYNYQDNRTDIVNLKTGQVCPFKPRLQNSWVKGEGIYINNTAVYWNGKKFFKWDGRNWIEESKPIPFDLKYGSSVFLPNGKWMLFDEHKSTFLRSAIYDGQSGVITEGPTLDLGERVGDNVCVSMISNTKMGIITRGGYVYTYDLLAKQLKFVRILPEKWSHVPAAPCHTLLYNGVPTGY